MVECDSANCRYCCRLSTSLTRSQYGNQQEYAWRGKMRVQYRQESWKSGDGVVAAVTEWSRAALNSANRRWRKGANTETLLSSRYATVVDSPITLPSKQQTKRWGKRSRWKTKGEKVVTQRYKRERGSRKLTQVINSACLVRGSPRVSSWGSSSPFWD